MADTTRHLLADVAPEAAAALLIEQAASIVHAAGRILGAAHMKRSFKITRSLDGSHVEQVKDPRADQLRALQDRVGTLDVGLVALANDLDDAAEKHKR